MSRSQPPGAFADQPPGPEEERRSLALTYVFWCLTFLGLCGIHRVYNRKPLSGILWLLTFGLCGIGQLVDLFLIPGMVEGANRRLREPAGMPLRPLAIDRQLLRLAREKGDQGFTINDALIDLDLPPQVNSNMLHQEIEQLLGAHLLDVGNDDRGRVVYREP